MSVSWMRPRQLIVWSLLLSLVASIVVVEGTDLFGSRPERDSHGHVVGEARMLLPAPVYELGAVELTVAGTVHRFQRDDMGAWFYHAHAGDAGSEGAHSHQTDPAAAERIEGALATFGRTRIERELPLGERLGEYGVIAPEMIITIYPPFESAPIASYAVGSVAPDTVSRYVMGSSSVVTVPNYQIENLRALIDVASRDPSYGWWNRSSP